MTDQSKQEKQAAAEKALSFIEPNMVLGVGTGSTVNAFIDLLATHPVKVDCAVASSNATQQRLEAIGIKVVDLNYPSKVHLYVDGADEVNQQKQMIKGGGGALTREKIIATSADKFVCMVDASKIVSVLGDRCMLPVEVIPMARGLVARALFHLKGNPVYREGVVTDNGNIILDVSGLDLTHAVDMEDKINAITGVVSNGLFAKRTADIVIVGRQETVDVY